jgi:hypothetical protein
MLIHTVYSADAWDGFQAKRLGKTSHSWTTFRLPRQGIEKGDGSVWSAEKYAPNKWSFPGSELVDGTIEGAMRAGLEGYPV